MGTAPIPRPSYEPVPPGFFGSWGDDSFEDLTDSAAANSPVATSESANLELAETALIEHLRDEHLVVVVPIKSFTSAKSRLTDVMSASARTMLAQYLAGRVLESLQGFQTVVICDDPNVEQLAKQCGASTLFVEANGLNAAVTAAQGMLRQANVATMAVVHSDILDPRDLPTLLHQLPHSDPTTADVVIVPDRHGTGTNILVVPVDAEFEFDYGENSFQSHCAHARSQSMGVVVVEHSELGWDVDVEDDLSALPAQLRSQLMVVNQ